MAQKGQKGGENGKKAEASGKKSAAGIKDKPQKQDSGKQGAEGQENESGQGVLRQLLQARNHSKTELGRAPLLPVPSPTTPAHAAATAIGRAAETLYQLPVQAKSVKLNGLSLAELPELLPEDALLIVLQGAGEAMGVMALCRETVTALIEMQTFSRVTDRPAPRRKLTRADALMCAEFANTLMAELGTELEDRDGFAGIGDFRYATYLDEPRPLALILEDKPFRSLSFGVGLGAKPARKATIFLALPKSAVAEEAEAKTGIADGRAAARQIAPPPSIRHGPDTATLASVVRDVPVEVVGILCRRRITLRELRALGDGQELALPRVTLSDATLELTSGQVLARGKLGEAEGCHAIRLHDPKNLAEEETGAAQPAPMAMRDMDGDVMQVAGPAETAMPVDLSAPDEFLAGSGEEPGANMLPILSSGVI
ncbi:FliM/FliN family flagellar motor C-terminal domain-containing protein [Paracoccus alkanivorans]|uniref:Flagellar motor switch protein FliN-like C-terminal domain-containing protein n=1 Tax=Paracoccus alkanivorans TaxID=2116655 RepID=A0A3M0MY73_9RHOB|nr:FliM/FliN family flagellar motor C-terminal domain-containing protein [Paracoccus alkanivorans]RMC36317.1 hypothetical protein C9E81_06460 [Paracoccus alkanivorans]